MNLDCCLTIVLPAALEEDFVDQMLEHPEWVRGFVITQAQGAGQNVPLSGAAERVRGRSARVQLQIVMARDDAHALLATLKTAFPMKEVAYWITPVVEFGRFA
jgi:hypothetical protein